MEAWSTFLLHSKDICRQSPSLRRPPPSRYSLDPNIRRAEGSESVTHADARQRDNWWCYRLQLLQPSFFLEFILVRILTSFEDLEIILLVMIMQTIQHLLQPPTKEMVCIIITDLTWLCLQVLREQHGVVGLGEDGEGNYQLPCP